MGEEVEKLVERLRSSAAAFRENTVYTADGDAIRLGVQADEAEEAATTLERVERERDQLDGDLKVMAQHANALSDLRRAAEAQVEALRKAGDQAKAALSAAQTMMMSGGSWRNGEGHLTDAALWLERAYTALVVATPAEESSASVPDGLQQMTEWRDEAVRQLLNIRMSRPTLDEVCDLSKLFNRHSAEIDSNRAWRINNWLKAQIADARGAATDAPAEARSVSAPNTFEVGKPAPYFCPACQAVPRAGYCKLAGCPTAAPSSEQAEGGR